jgi:glyoxylase I family protein
VEPTIVRIDHIYVTVRDLPRSEGFYDPVMQALGFRKGTTAVAGEPHAHYFNRVMQYTLRPARGPGLPRDEAADPYRAGALHHLCFQVRDAAAVDEAQRRLAALGVEASPPRTYPEYRPDYYATFFSDPDGIRLEIVCDTARRKLVRARWDELDGFVDPVARLLERDAQRGGPPALDLKRGNLFAAEPPAQGEQVRVLAEWRGATLEQILSSARPALDPYDQTRDEWVALLRGHAELDVAGEIVALGAGDYLCLPAHTPHRVRSTSAGALWLAVHVEPD